MLVITVSFFMVSSSNLIIHFKVNLVIFELKERKRSEKLRYDLVYRNFFSFFFLLWRSDKVNAEVAAGAKVGGIKEAYLERVVAELGVAYVAVPAGMFWNEFAAGVGSVQELSCVCESCCGVGHGKDFSCERADVVIVCFHDGFKYETVIRTTTFNNKSSFFLKPRPLRYHRVIC